MSVECWKSVRLQDVTTKVGSGSTPRGGEAAYKKTGTPLVRSMNVVFFGFKRAGLAHIDHQQAAALDGATIQSGDVLLNITGASIGRVTLAPHDMDGARVNQHVCIIRPSEAIDARFLNAFLSSPTSQDVILGENYGVTRQALTKQQILDFDIPLPPLPEQKRIADKLEALLGRVDACRSRLDRVPALLKRFRQSLLAAATSGKLTEEWREENGVADEWPEVRVQDVSVQVFDGPFGSHLKTADYTSTGIRVSRLENIGWMIFHADKEAYISPEKYKTLTRHTLKKDDVVFSSFISEETRVALLPDSWSGKAINKSDCYCVRVDHESCLPKFLMFRLACRSTYHILGEDVHGATRPRINLGQLKNFAFSLPTLPEQTEIVHRVEALFAFADRIEARLATSQKTVERLTPATLAKAFRGELVPQDPDDEPAAALLERLRDRKVSTPNKSQRGRRAKVGKPE